MTNKQLILSELNEQQIGPVVDYNGAMAIIAGPGSGKTKTVISRCAYMIEDGIDPNKIVLFTFTKKAANEIKERLYNKIGDISNMVTVSTYHSFCGKILRKYADRLGWKKNFSIYDDNDKNRIIELILKRNNNDRIKARQLNSSFSRFKEKMISPSLAKDNATNKYEQMVAEYYEEYANELKNNNAFDFDDLIYFVIRLCEQYEDILSSINQRFEYIIADESQDSSPRDLRLILFLGGINMNICLVGDDDQSIYSFRGVNIDSYYKFIDNYNLKKYILGRNYRSTKTIVDAAQSVIAKNNNRLEKYLYTENNNGNKIAYISLQDNESEAEYVSRTIKALINNTNHSYKDIAILYRVSFLSRIIEKTLFKNGIPYTISNGCAFYNRIEIKDIIGYLKYVANPQDLVALERIINVPRRGIGDVSLDKIMQSCQDYIMCDKMGLDALKNIKLKGKAQKGLNNFISIIEQIRCDLSNGISLDKIINKIIKLTKYEEYLLDLSEEELDDRINNLEELKKLSLKYQTLDEFLEAIALYEEDTKTNEENDTSDKVSLMTMHASKGLEFPIVIIVGANQNIIPYQKSLKENNVAEERRLFYVAMTRAKEELFITRPKKIITGYQQVSFLQSQFVNEINPSFIERR
jgi:DNA helicase-2/ATP-dependent DNA helicase PcrA